MRGGDEKLLTNCMWPKHELWILSCFTKVFFLFKTDRRVFIYTDNAQGIYLGCIYDLPAYRDKMRT